MPFKLPPKGIRFYDDVVERAMDLIYVGIWSGIHQIRLKTWLNNFESDLEKYFGACLLDSLIYRSEDQTNALATQVFQRVLPELAKLQVPPIGIVDDWLALFASNGDPGARLVAVLKPDDPPGKSGDIIARLLKRGFNINSSLLIHPEKCAALIAHGVKTFIFVDDFLGTGQQFDEVLNLNGLVPLLGSAFFAYAPLAAHESGVSALKGAYPTLQISAGEVLDQTHSIFSATCMTFADGFNAPADAKNFYYEFLHGKGVSLHPPSSTIVDPATAGVSNPPFLLPSGARRGFGHLELAYAFHHAIPDNCLPAFWWSHSSSWSPLFNR